MRVARMRRWIARQWRPLPCGRVNHVLDVVVDQEEAVAMVADSELEADEDASARVADVVEVVGDGRRGIGAAEEARAQGEGVDGDAGDGEGEEVRAQEAVGVDGGAPCAADDARRGEADRGRRRRTSSNRSSGRSSINVAVRVPPASSFPCFSFFYLLILRHYRSETLARFGVGPGWSPDRIRTRTCGPIKNAAHLPVRKSEFFIKIFT